MDKSVLFIYDESLLIGRKSKSVMDVGYVYAPYVMSIDCAVISDSNSTRRRRIINKIFCLGKDIVDGFSPSISVINRYSSNNIYINGVIKDI